MPFTSVDKIQTTAPKQLDRENGFESFLAFHAQNAIPIVWVLSAFCQQVVFRSNKLFFVLLSKNIVRVPFEFAGMQLFLICVHPSI